jgi:PPOX class probable F420-dependent enzyme
MDEREALERVSASRVARLATADAAGVPHVVPIVFVMDGRTLYSAVDKKPKRSKDLKRLRNITANPNVELIVDSYSDDWNELWWVRMAGSARVIESGAEMDKAVALLSGKYRQYSVDPPDDRVVAIEITRVSSWNPSGA